MQQTKILKLIWGALTGSQILYGFVLFTAMPPKNVSSSALSLWIPAAVIGIVSLAIFTTKLGSGPLARLFSEQPVKVAFGRVFVIYIICWAFNESVTLFGFVTAFAFTQDIQSFIPYVVAGLALNVLMFPRLDRYVQDAAAREGASITPS